MAVEKISIALDASVAAAARQAAEAEGLSLSAWINEAAEEWLAIERGLEGVAEHERLHGAPSPEALAEADRLLTEAGVFEP